MTPYSLARMMIKNVGGRVKHCLKIFSIVFLLFVLAWGVSVLLILGARVRDGRACRRSGAAGGRRARMREDAAERTRQPLLFAAHRRGGRALQVR